jgi:hypothetical protein
MLTVEDVARWTRNDVSYEVVVDSDSHIKVRPARVRRAGRRP